jgi:hypothetical protein
VYTLRSVILLTLIMSCGISRADGFKKYAGEFLNLGAGGRALGMGGAYVAVTNDVSAGYWNPAGLTKAAGLQIQFMHAKQFFTSIQYDYLGISNLFENGTSLGFSLIRLGVNNIKDSRYALVGESLEDGGSLDLSRIKLFSTSDYAFIVSYARPMNDFLRYGINAKLVYRDYSMESALGIGFDAGFLYTPITDLEIGLMARDITTTMIAWSTDEKEFIVPSLRTGISYIYYLSGIGLYIQPAFDLNILFESRETSSQMHLGLMSFDTFWGIEVGFRQLVFLRVGIDDLERFNGGAGLSIRRLAVDYSYTAFDVELGNVHRISFHLKLNSL